MYETNSNILINTFFIVFYINIGHNSLQVPDNEQNFSAEFSFAFRIIEDRDVDYCTNLKNISFLKNQTHFKIHG